MAVFLAACLYIAWKVPYTHDDWDWGLPVGVERLVTAGLNSRYGGTALVLAMTRSQLMKTLVMGAGMFLIPWLAARLTTEDEFYTEKQCISRYYFLAELYAIYLHEIGRITFRFVNRIKNEQTAYLSHCFYLKYARHHWFLWEMSLEERFVCCDIFDTYDIAGTHLNYLVYQLERITVW